MSTNVFPKVSKIPLESGKFRSFLLKQNIFGFYRFNWAGQLDWTTRVQPPKKAEDFSSHLWVQTGYGAHLTFSSGYEAA